MQQSEATTTNQTEKTELHRNQLAENLAFLVVQSHRRDQQQVEKSEEVFSDSES